MAPLLPIPAVLRASFGGSDAENSCRRHEDGKGIKKGRF